MNANKQSYAASKLETPFDWNAFLNLETFTLSKAAEAVHLAGGWVTCACGNQCDIIPRHCTGMPVDAELRQLGFLFNIQIRLIDLVVWGNLNIEPFRAEAKRILADIEKRSAILIESINAESKAQLPG